MSVPAALAQRVRAWIAADPDPVTRAELEALLARRATGELESRFGGVLAFGTAGLRGALGGGPMRMNRAVVRAAAAGVAAWVHRQGTASAGVVVGFDHRHGSAAFARDAAGVVAAAGIPVGLADRPWPTPVTAHAVLHRRSAAGVMVTASHNPATDNGFKVYDGTGAQIVPPADAEIAHGIASAGPAADIPCEPDHPLVGQLGDDTIEAYLADAARTVRDGPRGLRVVYTPVHGVGRDVFVRLWERAGFAPPAVVAEQADPDPGFPTAPFPNPEEPGVLDLALARAVAEHADLVLAHDPDADRLSVAIRDGDGYRVLTGDEVGVLLGWHALRSTTGDDRVVARSLPSSTWLDAVAADAGVPCRVTLTGFKWIARAGDADARRLVFGYEEALGYAVSPAVRDKDGMTAALAFADLAARESVTDVLAQLATHHGWHATAQWSQRFADAAGAADFTDRVRGAPPRELAGMAVVRVVDYADGVDGLPPADLVALHLDGGRVLVRPSGTEPKVKCYFEVVEPSGDRVRAAARLGALRESFQAALGTIER